ncbi:pyridoxamine 5'-phosphate oxidase family protein [Lactococcus lactis]|uniref:Pyridoxamine 5'-phosphate oxidase family protein n=1 Tax=Lactococcus lactis TaxID=1358 RepID=A0AAP5UAD7_9LACT|nr:pyridoxamine 5'-phosphate oxidase family protein [Lactococcus lactis]MDT2859940.1 pyridoxamine 5'-phosphate oxidase family protein [Lactococcus lactis]MDT2863195.1 pyridoxamine 5'-phosphate oxidase family protein [Lactococcus lactis]MDT2868632.1 pyridoxamine 5'-phosphate oxidase family protein [Lactococcus lactis]MDT2869555.1 pyridoxamine 5'-phosphate oxidase family protein [Lactococcus lactis]MDT2873151.1 pyridoxamine 5'-phosphate oxidase family protein [Lactococcus lactis]
MKVSLNIVDAIKLDKDNFTLHYKSIIIHGKPKEIIDEITKRKSMTLVCEKYISEDYPIEHSQRTYENTSEVLTVFEISIEEISGLGHEKEERCFDGINVYKKHVGKNNKKMYNKEYV